MKRRFLDFLEMKTFLVLWITQTFSSLGSAMTSYALVIWSYGQEGSALATALLMVCSYAPYVLFSLFAGAFTDRWNPKNVMLVCDAMAAASTLVILGMLEKGTLEIWHLYVLNAVNGLMNTVQQPASELAVTAVLPKKHYQRVGGIRYLGNSLTSILTPVLATAVMGLAGMDAVIWFDLLSFAAAFLVLLLFIHIPVSEKEARKESMGQSIRTGLVWLRNHRGIFDLMMFLAAINLVASMYNAAFPAMMLSRNGGSEQIMGLVNAVTGLSMLAGSLLASALPAPQSRIRVICNTLLISMSTENFLLAFGRSTPIWCIGAFLGWFVIPLMNTNLDAVMRLNIPMEVQGRVFAARNSFQFFTIPLGYLIGGWAVDSIFEPLLAAQSEKSILIWLFGQGKGSGAACFFAVIAFAGLLVCLVFRKDRHIWMLEK